MYKTEVGTSYLQSLQLQLLQQSERTNMKGLFNTISAYLIVFFTVVRQTESRAAMDLEPPALPLATAATTNITPYNEQEVNNQAYKQAYNQAYKLGLQHGLKLKLAESSGSEKKSWKFILSTTLAIVSSKSEIFIIKI